MSHYTGSCHCGAVQFTADIHSLDAAITCNCSMCRRAGTILVFLPPAQFALTAGEASLTSYQFNAKVIDHLFCRICGIKPFSKGKDPSGNTMFAVNVRCLDGIDSATLSPTPFDGASL